MARSIGSDAHGSGRNITAFMASAAVVQSASALTMADIIRQKIIALGFNMQNWNDMRRFNYSAGNIGTIAVVYKDYKELLSTLRPTS